MPQASCLVVHLQSSNVLSLVQNCRKLSLTHMNSFSFWFVVFVVILLNLISSLMNHDDVYIVVVIAFHGDGVAVSVICQTCLLCFWMHDRSGRSQC